MKHNKFQKFSKIKDEIEVEDFEAVLPVKRKGHGDQRQANRRAKQMRQDVEFNSAIKETFHAS